MNFTWNAPVTRKYGTTQQSSSTSICVFFDRTGSVASSASSEIPATTTTAMVLCDRSRMLAGRSQPTTRYPIPSRHGMPRRDMYSNPAHAAMPNGKPYPQTASWRM